MSVPLNQKIEIADLPLGDGQRFIGKVDFRQGDRVVVAHEWAQLGLTRQDFERSYVMSWIRGTERHYLPVRFVRDEPGRLICRMVFEEKRDSLRVRCDVELKFSLVPEPALPEAAEMVLSRITQLVENESDVERLMHSDQEEDELRSEVVAIRRLLERMTMQMDQLVAAVEGRTPKADLSEKTATDVMDVSATGLSFRHGQRVEMGHYLKLRMDFRGISGPPMEALGVVIRCLPRTGKALSPDEFDYGVKFTHIREIDREAIVRHIFRVQRNLLRERKAEAV